MRGGERDLLVCEGNISKGVVIDHWGIERVCWEGTLSWYVDKVYCVAMM